jgi:LL-diaminopimelate aminotransferase
MRDPFERTARLQALPPYVFAKIDRIVQDERAKGRSLISLGIGDPDLPTPEFIIDRLTSVIKNPKNHKYPSYWGMIEFRKAVATWFEKRFKVSLNPQKEVLALIGSKEGIAHLPLAFINPGEAALVPDPGYPVYHTATTFAGGVSLHYSLKEENGFLPDFSELEALVKSGPRVRLLFLNYPNNPTSACATLDLFKELVAFAKKHQILLCHDNAYSEIYFDGKPQPSLLEVPGGKEVGCEFHSLSKTYNMAGWRIGFLVGHEKIIDGLAQVKTNIDSGVFNACQEAGITALENGEGFCSELRSIYQQRRDLLVPALQKLGLSCKKPQATFYVWARTPGNMKSEDFVMNLIKKCGIVSTPGNGFGPCGEGYVRFTLCSDGAVLKQVAQLLEAFI